MLNIEDLPVDSGVIAQDTIDNLDEMEDAANAGVILGQLDPLEIDLQTGLPRWNEAQREVIIKFNDELAEWRE